VRRNVLLLALLLLAALAAGLVWLVLTGDEGGSRLRDESDVVAPAPDSDGEAQRGRTRIAEEKPPAPETAPEVAPPIDDGPPVEPWPESGLEVDVVREGDGQPVAGVIVWVAPMEKVTRQAGWHDARLRASANPFAALRERSRGFETDDAGHVRLPSSEPGDTLWIGAQQGELSGQLSVYPDSREERHELVLAPRLAIRVHVRSSRGESLARFPVHIGAKDEWSGFTLALADTGADGIAVFADVGNLRSWAGEDDLVIVARPAVPMADPPQAPIDFADTSGRPLELVVPDGGVVSLRVLDVSGDQILGVATVTLDAVRHGTYADPSRPLVRPAVGGSVLIPHVGLGIELVAMASDPSGRFATTLLQFAGPTRVGEEVHADLVFTGERLVITGRLVDAGGEPVSGADLRAGVLLTTGDAEPTRGQALTGDDGRFRIVVDHSRTELAGRTLDIVRYERADNAARFRSVAQRPLPSGLPDGPLRLGDVVLAKQALIVSGRVTGERGEPVTATQVMIATRTETGWAVRHSLLAATDADGRFEVRGEVPEGARITLGLRDDAYVVVEPPEFDAGATDVEVRALAAGAIAGSIKLPEGLVPDDLYVVVTGDAAERPTWRKPQGADSATTYTHDDGSFEVRGLVTGSATVHVRFADQTVDLATVSGVTVSAGKVMRDPRLQGIDISKAVVRHAIRVVDSAGNGVAQAHVHFRPSGSDGEWLDARTAASGNATVFAGAGPIDVLALADGYGSATADGVDGATQLTLKPARPVGIRVTLAPDSAVPTDGRTLEVELVWIGPLTSEERDLDNAISWDDPRGRGFTEQALARGRDAVFSVVEPGWYAVQVGVGTNRRAAYSMTWIYVIDGAEAFPVTRGGGARVLRVVLSAESLAPK